MPIKGSFTTKNKNAKYGDQFTQEEKRKYWANKQKEIEQKKLDFVKSVIEYAKNNKRFPWQEPNFNIYPQSVFKLKQIEKFEQKNPGIKVPSVAAEYQGANFIGLTMVSMMRGYKDNRWITLPHIWKMGGKISETDMKKKGVEIWIVNPEGAIRRERDEKTGKWEVVYKRDKETGEFLLDKKGNKIPEKVPTYSTQKVYNVEHVTGLDLPKKKFLTQIDEKEKCPEMESIIAYSEAPVMHDLRTGFNSHYLSDRDEIHVPPIDMFKSITAYYSTVAHEIGHSTGHQSRLNRKFGTTKDTKEYAREELVAELTSVFLSQELGIQIPPKELANHQEYLRGWDSQLNVLTEKPEELYAIITDAEKATKYIKEHMLEKELNHDKVLEEIKKVKITEEKTEEKKTENVSTKKKESKGMKR